MNFHNDIDETLGKPNYYTTVMGDFKTQIGIRTNPMETATSQFGLELKQQNRWHLGRMVNIKKVQNHEYHVSE